jgi:hypothetical protein
LTLVVMTTLTMCSDMVLPIKMVWDDPRGERVIPLLKERRLMDEISLAFCIGRWTEYFSQKRGGQLKGGETGHLRSQEDGLDSESG